jgi:hypothetical protein
MDLRSMLLRSGGIQALARQAEAVPPLVSDATSALLPHVLGAMRDFAEGVDAGDGGLRGLLTLFEEFGDSNLAAEVMSPEATPDNRGELLLARLFPEPGARALALAAAASNAGEADAALLARVLPQLAMLLGGYFSARAGGGGSLDWLDAVLDGEDAAK